MKESNSKTEAAAGDPIRCLFRFAVPVLRSFQNHIRDKEERERERFRAAQSFRNAGHGRPRSRLCRDCDWRDAKILSALLLVIFHLRCIYRCNAFESRREEKKRREEGDNGESVTSMMMVPEGRGGKGDRSIRSRRPRPIARYRRWRESGGIKFAPGEF